MDKTQISKEIPETDPIGKSISRFRTLLLLYLLACIPTANHGQVIVDTGRIFNEISNILTTMPGHSGDDYNDPGESDLAAWDSILDDLLAGSYSQAGTTAELTGYDLIRFVDTSNSVHKTYYILENNGNHFWGTYVYNPDYCRPLVIQVPHPKKEINTGKEGIHVFRKTEALFYCLSGTSRCNHSSFSSCDGKTSICSDSAQNYRISDMAHNVTSIFQKTTEKLLDHFTNSYFVQLHGFAKLSSDPYVILSNGTAETPDRDYIPLLKDNLLNEDTSLTFKIAHIDSSWTRLRGFTITQGRLINGSPDPCYANATSATGRFIDIEQERTKLRDNQAGWDKVAIALSNTFVCFPYLWVGTSDTDWNNAANWRENAVPGSPDNVSIAKGIFDPVIKNDPMFPAQCHHLEIQTLASLAINPGKALTAGGNITNYGSFILRSDTEGTGSLIDSSGYAEATVERYLTYDEWHYISAPVDDPKAEVFLGMYMIAWDEPAGQWNEIIDPGYVMSTDMQGFAIWNWDAGTVTFSGILNTGAKSFYTTNTSGTPHDNQGFNFCGNPYPSSLNWNVDEGSGWNRTAGNTDLSLYIWNQDAGNYGVYMKDDPTGTNSVDSIIPPHQGFFVHCSAVAGYIGVDNRARVHASRDILKEGAALERSLLKLKVEGNHYADEILLFINPSAKTGYDVFHDALKFRGDEEAPQLYSLSEDNRELSVNAFPETDLYDIIPIGLEVGKDGKYFISVSESKGFTHGSKIYLEDLKTGIFTKIESSSSYDFTAATNEIPLRFMLHLNENINGTELSDGSINIYSLDKTIYIETPLKTKGKIIIYNMLGQVVVEKSIEAVITRISVGRSAPYIVYVTGNKVAEVRKVLAR